MRAAVLTHEVRELQARYPGWLCLLLRWSSAYALHGPNWIPMIVRKLPLRVACAVAALYARGWL